MKRRMLSLLLCLCMVLTLLPSTALASNDTTAAPVVKNDVNVTYRRNLDNQPAEIYGMTYDENWFFEDSYEYNAELAEMSIGLAFAGYDDSSSYDTSGKTGDQYIRALYKQLGFSDEAYYSTGYNQADNENVALSISSKSIEKDGNKITLLVVDLRSGGYGDGGWQGNFNVGEGVSDTAKTDHTKYHVGFYNGACFAVEKINDYIANHSINTANTKLWLVGYSRGAAVANLTSILLGKDKIPRANIFTYAGATPTYELNPTADPTLANIFNIINSGDIVTMAPPTSWGFGRQGTTINLPALTDENRMAFEIFFYDLAGIGYYGKNDYSEVGNVLFALLTKRFGSRQVYARQLQAVVQSLFTTDENGKTDFSYINGILNHCDPNSEDPDEASKIISVEKIVSQASGIDIEDMSAVLGLVATLGDGLKTAEAYWKTVEDSYNDELLSNVYKIINAVIGIAMGFGSEADTQMLEALKATFAAGNASPLLFQHWTELYIARMRAQNCSNPFEINYLTEKITVKNGYEVSADATFVDNGKNVANDSTITPDTTYYVRKQKDGNVPASAALPFTTAARPAAPTTVIHTDETVQGKKDGKLSHVTAAMQYSKDNGVSWTDGTGKDITGLSGETVLVRVKATETTPCGENTTVTFTASTATLTVTFNSNGGGDLSSLTDLSYNAIISAPIAPQKANNNFAGWYKDAALTQAWNFSTDKVADNITLYARWSAAPVYQITGKVTQAGASATNVPGATVELKQGNNILASTTTDSGGDYTFSTVPAGTYNIVVTTSDGSKTKTAVAVIENANQTVNVELPAERVSSVVEVKPATPAVVVGGLDAEAVNQKEDGSTVIITLAVESRADVTSDPGDSDEKTAQSAIKTEAAGKTVEFLDLTVNKTVNGGNAASIPTTGEVLSIRVPYRTSGRNNITVYRCHGTSAMAFVKEDAEMTTPADGHYYVGNGYLMIYAKEFSTYAIGYTVPAGGDTSIYTITAPTAKNGKLSVSSANASSGATVTVTVTPDKGYTLETLNVIDANGKAVTTIKNSNGTYSFTMPSSKVTVTATFMDDNTMLNYFVDVPASAYYYDAVLWAAKNEITSGTDATHFDPDGICTRTQAVTFLWRASGEPEPTSAACPFTDVKADAYYYKAVLWAVEKGVASGTGAATFSPDAACTRAQIVTFQYRAAGSPTAGTASPFADVADRAYYADAVKWAVAEGVTSGTTTATFSPDVDCTRAQIVTFLYRQLGK